MSLKSIIEQMEQKKADLNADVDTSSPVYRMVLGNKIRAQEDLDALQVEYEAELRKRLILTVSTGSLAEDLSKIASEDFEMTIINGEALIDETLSKVVLSEYIGRDFGPHSFKVFRDALMDTFRDNKMDDSIDMFYDTQTHSTHMANTEQLRSLLISSIIKDMTILPFIGKILKDAASAAIKEQFDGKVYPVMVVVKNEQLAKTLSEDVESILVVAGESSLASSITVDKIDKESVKKAMGKIKNQAKKEKRHENQ